jgi:hypothetical protein
MCCTTFPLIFLHLWGPATALNRKFVHDLTTARHFKNFFVICTIWIFAMNIEKFQLRGNNSVCPGAFQLLWGRAPAQLRGNIDTIWCTKINSEIHQLINSVWNKKEFPQQLKESVITPVYTKGDKPEVSSHRDISHLSTTYTILSNILLPRLTPYATTIRDHQCWFWHNRSTTGHIQKH